LRRFFQTGQFWAIPGNGTRYSVFKEPAAIEKPRRRAIHIYRGCCALRASGAQLPADFFHRLREIHRDEIIAPARDLVRFEDAAWINPDPT
jgi:hypothetical protein